MPDSEWEANVRRDCGHHARRAKHFENQRGQQGPMSN